MRKMEAGSKGYNDNYIFFSYSHMNADEAKTVIDSLREAGHSVWYDDGVDPGVSWDDYIAERIEYCRCFTAYVTAEYACSANCIDEISYARDNGKKIVLIYAEDAEFPRGLQMRLSAAERLRTSDYNSSSSFYKVLFDIEGVSACRTGNTVPDVPPRPKKKRRASSKRSVGRKIPVLPIVLILLLIAFIIVAINKVNGDSTSSQGVRCTICEMNFTLPDDSYIQETDRKTAFSNYEKLHIPARERGEGVLKPEDFIELQWYNGQGNKYLLAAAQAASFSNDEFEEAADMITLDKIGIFHEFQIGSVSGRYGIVKISGFTNTDIQCLNNGVFYNIEFLNTELEDDEINAFIESIDFNAVLDDQTVYCGDISLTVPGNYYEAAHEWDDGRQDPHLYMCNVGSLREVIAYYYDSESGRSAPDLAGAYADYYKTDITERDKGFGKSYFLELVYEENGAEYSEVMALFEISGKTYVVELISDQPDITIDSMEDIVSTIEVSE